MRKRYYAINTMGGSRDCAGHVMGWGWSPEAAEKICEDAQPAEGWLPVMILPGYKLYPKGYGVALSQSDWAIEE